MVGDANSGHLVPYRLFNFFESLLKGYLNEVGNKALGSTCRMKDPETGAHARIDVLSVPWVFGVALFPIKRLICIKAGSYSSEQGC